MKKIILFLIFFIFHFTFCYSQNLIYNGDFEIYDTCPSGMSVPGDYEIEHCLGWHMASDGTSDYYNTCATIGSNVNVPYSTTGYQWPLSGNGFMGLFCYVGDDNYREYIETKLNFCLQENVEYYIEFYVCLANHSYYGINRIGALFTNEELYQANWDYISAIPQIANPLNNIITDTLNWTKISGTFIAHGGECYMTIGNFYDWNETDTIISNPNIGEATYYYVDGVILKKAKSNIELPNAFTPDGDGVNDIFHVNASNVKEMHSKIINRWGQSLYEWDDINGGWDGKLNGVYAPSGTYYYIVSIIHNDNSKEEKKGALELIR